MPPARGPLSVTVSVVAHIALICLLSLWLMVHVPQVTTRLPKDASVHVMNLSKPDPVPDHTPIQFASQHTSPRPMHATQRLGVAHPAPKASSAPQMPQMEIAAASAPVAPVAIAKPSPVVVQPPVPKVPVVELAPAPASIIATANPPVPGDIKISPTAFSSPMPQMPASNLIVALDANAQPSPGTPQPAVQQTSAQLNTAAQTPPAELHMADGGIAPSRPVAARGNGTGASNGAGAGIGAGNGIASSGDGRTTAQAGSAAGSPTGSAATPGTVGKDAETADRITLPKDGKYGVVVMGASLTDEFPEAASIWGGRMPYTVYVHVGLAKSWILQYSLPNAAADATVGSPMHLDAPWPYDIMRPNITPGEINGDALMVRGIVDRNGHFETLAVVSPQQFRQEKFVLEALRQWQFRPAVQNGQTTDVEVLLIIPDELD